MGASIWPGLWVPLPAGHHSALKAALARFRQGQERRLRQMCASRCGQRQQAFFSAARCAGPGGTEGVPQSQRPPCCCHALACFCGERANPCPAPSSPLSAAVKAELEGQLEAAARILKHAELCTKYELPEDTSGAATSAAAADAAAAAAASQPPPSTSGEGAEGAAPAAAQGAAGSATLPTKVQEEPEAAAVAAAFPCSSSAPSRSGSGKSGGGASASRGSSCSGGLEGASDSCTSLEGAARPELGPFLQRLNKVGARAQVEVLQRIFPVPCCSERRLGSKGQRSRAVQALPSAW